MRPLLLLLLLALPASAEIYKWVDANGKVHYSDKPVSGAEAVVPKESSTVSLPARNHPPAPPRQDPIRQPYQIDFSAPSDNATVRNNSGQLALTIALEPELARQHKVQLLLDGKPVRTLGSGGSFALDNLDRGEHQLQAQVIDKNGKVLASSPSRTVFLHRHSQLFPTGPQPSGSIQ
ncbi:DUF4124 domain-containing protein [uncultured Ferrimonas sp.]|uniref:DUF4124 domain-containing protein n=1 Tax=uncultured Ferrimonas sp. TaxID=432640 RepID=UPI0026030122|nr:DUF4124 domain-containing protein [uncultured Ferrimonas sp.]